VTPDLRPSEQALLDWVRPRLNAAIVRDIAGLDYGMRVQEYQDGIEDVLLVRRLPRALPWPAGEVLNLCGHTDPVPGPPGHDGHVARLFCCMVLVGVEDTMYPAGALAALVESALELGPDATAAAVRFVAWCRQETPGAWRHHPGSPPFLTLGLLVLYTMTPEHDAAFAADLRDTFVREVEAQAEWPGQPPAALFKATAGSERRRTWRALVGRYLTGQDPSVPSVATLRTWFTTRATPRRADT
jgi:hypothetical protein